MCGPQFCSMKISQDLRDEAAAIEAREWETAHSVAIVSKRIASEQLTPGHKKGK
jgi:hypothetical protein